MQQQGFNAYMTKPIDETMLSHIIYEYCDLEHFSQPKSLKHNINKVTSNKVKNDSAIHVFDWSLALKRSANKPELAKEMFVGLLNCLNEIEPKIKKAIAQQDLAQLQRNVHKLNGACCYTGTPNLAKITSQLETQLKIGLTIEELEPEFLEFFEHTEQVRMAAPNALETIG